MVKELQSTLVSYRLVDEKLIKDRFSQFWQFLADYIEPSRTHESCKKVRAYYYGELAVRGRSAAGEILDEACLLCLDDTLSYLLAKGNIIDLETVKTRNALLAKKTG